MITFAKLSWADPKVRRILEETTALRSRLPSELWANVILLSLAFLLLDFEREDWDGLWEAVKQQALTLDDAVTPIWERLRRYFDQL